MGQKQSYDLTAAEADMNRRPSFEGTIDTSCTTTGWAAMYSTRKSKSKKRDHKNQEQDKENAENIDTTQERGIEVEMDKDRSHDSVPVPTAEPPISRNEKQPEITEIEKRVQEVPHCPLDMHITIQKVEVSEPGQPVSQNMIEVQNHHHYDYVCGEQTERIELHEEEKKRESRSHSIVVLKIGDDEQIIEETPCERNCGDDTHSIQPESIKSFSSNDDFNDVETLNKRNELDQIPLTIKINEAGPKSKMVTKDKFTPIITEEPKRYSSIDLAEDEKERHNTFDELSMDQDISHIETRIEPVPEEILVFQEPMTTTNIDVKPTYSNYT